MTTMIISTYSIFAAAGVGVTLWVAHKLDLHGVTFAKAGDRYDAETGPAMSHLLVVGFALVALGVVSLALGNGKQRTDSATVHRIAQQQTWLGDHDHRTVAFHYADRVCRDGTEVESGHESGQSCCRSHRRHCSGVSPKIA